VVQEVTYCWKFPGETAEISLSELKSLLQQLELELCNSELYRQIQANLQGLPEDLGHQIHRMVTAIGKAGVRLAMQKLVTKKDPSSPHGSTLQADPGVATPPAIDSATVTEPSSSGQPGTTVELTSPGRDRQFPETSTSKSLVKKPRKRLSKREKAAQAALQAWESRLQDIGQEICQLRQTQSLSLHHLHFRTQIPLYQLAHLEAGNIAKLPEDIYIRGFLRRIGTALGIDGIELANSLPLPPSAGAVIPTWHPSQKKTPDGFHLHPVHLYVGYAALLAGGVSWLSHQTAFNQSQQPNPTNPLPATVSVPASRDGLPGQSRTSTPTSSSTQNSTPAAKKSTKQAKALGLASIAPPETSPAFSRF